MRNNILLQAIGVTALLASGLFGVIANRWPSFQSGLAYAPPVIGLAIGATALAVYAWRRDRFIVWKRRVQWSRSAYVVYWTGGVILTCGFGFFIKAFGRRPDLPPHEGFLGFWVAVFGLAVVLLGRFMGRKSI